MGGMNTNRGEGSIYTEAEETEPLVDAAETERGSVDEQVARVLDSRAEGLVVRAVWGGQVTK